MAAASGIRGRFKELLVKYGKVALGVHCTVSAASITGLYIAIKNNVDIESLFEKYHISGVFQKKEEAKPASQDGSLMNKDASGNLSTADVVEEKKKNRMAELAASSGGALTLAVLCNKALFPIRVPITVALTPPLSRFLARRNLIKNHRVT